MDYEPKRFLSKFTALAAELRKKNESDSKIIIRKNQIAIEKAKKQTKKKERSVSKLKMILCLPFLPRFPKFSLHQSSTNILSRMIYQMFTKAEVSTGSYTLSDSLGKLLRLNLT